MNEETGQQPSVTTANDARADALLSNFLQSSPAVQLAATSLRAGAEVGVSFTNLAGDWRIKINDSGKVYLEPHKADDPDFELRMPPGAVQSLCTRDDADVGDLGVAFFEHIVAKEQDLRIHVTPHSGLVKLTRRGWLMLVARGGSKVALWMAKKGLRGPGAIANALGRLKS